MSTGAAPEPERAGGKGRPTPKRRDAERRRRGAVVAPTTRREAYRQVRERNKQARKTARRALVSGAERDLPARDAGPVKAWVRDFVDGRRNAATYFLPGALVIFVLGSIPAVRDLAVPLWFITVIFMLIDTVTLGARLRSEVRSRFAELPERDRKGAALYGVLRALQLRRLRLPPPRTKPPRPRLSVRTRD